MSLWSLGAPLSVGAIGRGYATTLGELGSHRHGRGGDERGDFVAKTEQKQGGVGCDAPSPTGEADLPLLPTVGDAFSTPWAAPSSCKLLGDYWLSSTLAPATCVLSRARGG